MIVDLNLVPVDEGEEEAVPDLDQTPLLEDAGAAQEGTAHQEIAVLQDESGVHEEDQGHPWDLNMDPMEEEDPDHRQNGAQEEESGSKQKMDADGTGTSKGGRPGHLRKKLEKLKFKPKVPTRKPKKLTPEKQQQEELKPIDEELMKTLRTIRGAAKSSPHIKAGVSSPLLPSIGHMQGQPKEFQIPRVFPVAANRAMFYDDEDDEDDDDYEEEDDNIELQDNQPSSTECESLTHPAKELNLLEQDDKTRMFLFQLPKSLPLPKVSSTGVERNVKGISKGVKEGYNMNELPGGYLGKMLIYRSGKIKMKLGVCFITI